MGCICWSINPKSSIVFLSLPVLIIPFIIGLVDDLIHLRALAKLVGQLATASLIFFFLDIRVTSLYGLLGNDVLPMPLSYLLTVITVILITNSLNLIDGIDGLAATFSFVACLFFGSWFYFSDQYPLALLCFSLAGGILAFLFQNWEPSNIFMGDTGSLVIGTVLSVVTIAFLNQNQAMQQDHPLKFNSSIATAICALIIPLTDTTRIVIVRLSKGISPLQADKRHIHHTLVRLGLSHRRAVMILTLAHAVMIGIAVILREANQWLLLGAIVSLATTLCLILDWVMLKTVQKEGQ